MYILLMWYLPGLFQTTLFVMLEVAVAVLPRTCESCSGMRSGSSHHSGELELQDDDVEIDLQDENSFDQDSTSNRLKEHCCCSLV